MNNKQIIIGAIAVFGIIALTTLYQYVFQGPRDISRETAQHHFSSDALFKVFIDGEGTKLLDKVVQIQGKVTEIGSNSAVLENKIQMYFTRAVETEIQLGDSYMFKGRCVGFDDLLELVKIDQAILTQ